MARKLRVDAHVVKRACQYRDENRAGVGTGCCIRAIIATLTSRYSSYDEPNYDDEPSDSHIYLRKTGGSCSAEEPRLTVSTPPTTDTHAGWSLNAIYPPAEALPDIFRSGVSCLLMARDAETARCDSAEKEAPARPPLPRPTAGQTVPSEPADDIVAYPYTTDLAAIRAIVQRYAVKAGLSEARAIDLVLAVSEVAANTVRHAKSPGCLQIWRDARQIVCQLHDEGVITDPLAGRRRPSLEARGGHGLWIVNQVCDQVDIVSDETGTTIRLHMDLPV